jgi:acyl-CoA thioester hydrolase
MADEQTVPAFFFAPFVSSTMRVEPGWIDYNGHMNMAYYVVLFDRALDQAFGVAGLGPDYVETRRLSYFTAETHTVYRRELSVEDAVRVTLQLVAYDEKRLRTYLEIRHATEGWVAATCEILALHVDMDARRVTPFPEDILANLAAMKAAHARLSRPEGLGRGIGMRRPEPRGVRHEDEDGGPVEIGLVHH